MSTPESGRYVVPSPRVPKTLGTLHIVFATLLMMCGICMGVYVAILPVIAKGMNQVTKQAEATVKKQQEQAIQSLEAQEKAAATEEEKTELRQRREQLEAQSKKPVKFPMMDMSKMGWDDPKFVLYAWGDVLSGLVVNVLMLIAGIGLVGFKRWGITLGLWVAALKMARLLLVYGFFIIAVVPPYSRNTADMAVDMLDQQQAMGGQPMGGPPKVDMRALLIKTYTITYSITGVGMILGGMIYPAVSLWLLSRPGTRAACVQAAQSQPLGPKDL